MEHSGETKTNTEVELFKKEETAVEEDEKISTTQTFYESDNEEEDVKPDVDLIRKDLMEHALRMGFVSSGKTDEGDVKGDLGKRKSNSAPLDTLFGGGADGCVKKVKKEEPFEEDFKSSIVKTEDGTNVKKEDGELEDGEIEDGELPDEPMKPVKVRKLHPVDYNHFNRKRKVALLIAYSGGGFHGMQKNPDVETIELRLMEALAAIQAIRPDLKNEFLQNNNNQISFNRAARTDKGVSAARQVVSLKIVANEKFLEDVNRELPEEIRVFGLERTTKSFDAKCSCSGRSYEYLVPTVAFAPSREILDASYRLSDEQFEKINTILGMYVGTHNFHNFTSGKRFTDKSAFRYITGFSASKPFECRGHEFIALEVSGQSFLIHQIRKMVGLAIAICRGYCDVDTVDRAWLEHKLDIPKAPGLGLLLNRVNYKAYNQKYGSDGQHNRLTWENCELDVERYKIERLWHTIIEEEIKRSSCVTWLKTLSNHTYTHSGMNAPMTNDFHGKRGIFPEINPQVISGDGGGK